MGYCRQCRTWFREPADEQGDHGCPRCPPLPRKPLCYHCGEPCSGDVTEYMVIPGVGRGEFPVCDDETECFVMREAKSLAARIADADAR